MSNVLIFSPLVCKKLRIASLFMASMAITACEPNVANHSVSDTPKTAQASSPTQLQPPNQQASSTPNSNSSAQATVAKVAPLPNALIERYPTTTPTASISGGTYRPLYLSKDSPMVKVTAFELDKVPVTNAQFYRFLSQNPKWQKQNIAKLFTETDYLKHWQLTTENTYQPAVADLQKPVVYVSWYTANAYCQSQGKKLPSVAQWEYVAQASPTQKNGSKEKGYNQKILDWYADSAKKPLTEVGQDPANIWGVHNLHGLIWEWTDDFNSNLVSGESRADSNLNQGLFCGSGAAGAVDPSDYAAFMRYGFRSSLQSKFALSSLGFRCATE